MEHLRLQVRDYTGVYCADCGKPLWTADVFERPTAERSIVALVCEACFMARPFGPGGPRDDGDDTDQL